MIPFYCPAFNNQEIAIIAEKSDVTEELVRLKSHFDQFEKILKSKTILMGFGLDSDAIHSPNEHFGVSNFLNGIETITKFYHHYTK